VVANDNMQQDDQAADTFVERLAAERAARGRVKDLGGLHNLFYRQNGTYRPVGLLVHSSSWSSV
jgi:hypothetical protein